MLEEIAAVLRSLLVLLPILVSAALALLKLTDHQSKWLRWFGSAGLVIIALYAVGELSSVVKERLVTAQKRRGSLKYTPRVPRTPFSEASGATYLGSYQGQEYVLAVDDERSRLFLLRFDAENRDYSDVLVRDIELPHGAEISDLEAVASFDGAAYAITSHSNDKHGKPEESRQRMIKVEFPEGLTGQPRTTLAGDLRQGLERVLEGLNAKGRGQDGWKNKGGKVEMMNIEGLAIDGQGLAYVGFRSPLVDNHALMLQIPVASLFGSAPVEWRPVLLDLSYSDEDEKDESRYRRSISDVHYGIVSLEYDPYTNRVVVLSNAENREDWYKPVLWSFEAGPVSGGVIYPDRCDVGDSDVTSAGKPEAIVVHPVEPGSTLTRMIEWVRGGKNGPISLFYDVSDRGSLFRVLNRYDLCAVIHSAPL